VSKLSEKLTIALVPYLGYALLKLIHFTNNYHYKGQEHLEGLREKGEQSIWVTWHNRLLPSFVVHGGRNLGPIASQSKDGELISRLGILCGYSPIRGSTSRGGAKALKAMIKHLRSGFDIFFTPDGPRGPRYRVQQGAAAAAKISGKPILPLGISASRKIVFNSWDRFQLPMFFSRIQVVYGKPLYIGRDEDIDEACEKIRVAMTDVNDEADRLNDTTSP
jgi:lysophospholipid acyltransferase (LPLAT)-like uncharacterized protein